MRTIKFRGKKEFSNEWLVGSLLSVADEHFIFPEEAPHSYNTYRVNPETVGQFTGLLDKNGIEIYEGDIVAVYDEDFNQVGQGKVEFLEDWGVWYIGSTINDGLFDVNNNSYIEVIGNVYDDEDLLKE